MRALRVVTACEALRRAAVEYRSPLVTEAMASRMGVAMGDRRLALALAIISVTVIHACSVVVASGVPLRSAVIAREVANAVGAVAAQAADLDLGAAR